MPKYLEAAEAAARGMEKRTHDTEKRQSYERGESFDSRFMDVNPVDKYDEGEAMRRGMQGGDAELPHDEPVEGIRAKDPVAMTTDPTLRGRDVHPRTGRIE